MKSLLNHIQISRCLNNTHPGKREITTDYIDSECFSGFVFLVFFGQFQNRATVSIKVQGLDETTSNPAPYKGSTITKTATADISGYTAVIEVYKPEYKKNRLVIEVPGQNVEVNGAVSLLYSGRKLPVKQVLDTLQLVSPEVV